MKKLFKITIIAILIEFILLPVTITINLFLNNTIGKHIIYSNLIFLAFTIIVPV